MSFTRIPGRLAIALAAASLAVGISAHAADYSVTGTAHDYRVGIELPIPETLQAPPRGLTAMGTAMQTGAPVAGGGPATITLPPNIISDVPTVANGFLIPVPFVIQLTTQLNHLGPTATTTLMAGRTGPGTFAFCPGAAANPNCTTAAAGGSQGTVNGIIKYTAGPNKFGGTFRLLLTGTGKQTNKGDALPPTVMTPMGGTRSALPFSVKNRALGGGGGGGALVGAGLPYAQMTTGLLLPSPITHPYSYNATPKGLLNRGPVIGFGSTSSYNQQTAFPMTTGVFYGYVQIGGQATVPAPPFKVTSSGYDKRTAGGVGRIQLVGGSLSRAYPTDGSNPPEGGGVNRLALTLTFSPQPALPLGSPAMLLTLGSLVMLGAGYAVTGHRRK